MTEIKRHEINNYQTVREHYNKKSFELPTHNVINWVRNNQVQEGKKDNKEKQVK